MRYWKPKKIPGKPKVGIAVASFLETARDLACLRCLVACFQAQTYANWQILVTHDGPMNKDAKRLAHALANDDERVQFIETPERLKQFGHPYRQAAIDRLLRDGCEWICLTNQDNYYAPIFLEGLLGTALAGKRAKEFVYCDCVHSHRMWRFMGTEPRRGRLDLGGWMAKASLVKQVKFDNFNFDGDGKYIERLRGKARGIEKVAAALFVHN